MTAPDLNGIVGAVLRRLDWLSSVGARAVRAVAVVDALAVAAFWVVVGRHWGLTGTVVSVIALLPAAWLWWFGSALDEAVDRTKIELDVHDLLAKTGRSIGDVAAARTQSWGLLRAGWRAVRSVKALRDDVDRLGLDFAAWATVANPGSLLLAGLAVLASGAIGLLAALAIILKLVL